MMKLNGTEIGAGIQKIERYEKTEYKYNLITESGHKRSEIRAKYRGYTVLLGSIHQKEYDELYRILSTGTGTFEVTLPDGQDDITFEATVTMDGDTLSFIESNGTRRWDNLTLQIEGVNPK